LSLDAISIEVGKCTIFNPLLEISKNIIWHKHQHYLKDTMILFIILYNLYHAIRLFF